MGEMHTCQKRDQACIWFAHIPSASPRCWKKLPPDTLLCLLINGHETSWKRMKIGTRNPIEKGADTVGFRAAIRALA